VSSRSGGFRGRRGKEEWWWGTGEVKERSMAELPAVRYSGSYVTGIWMTLGWVDTTGGSRLFYINNI
jgi:hypothetical protein